MAKKLYFKDERKNTWLIVLLLSPIVIILLIGAVTYIKNLDFGSNPNAIKDSSEIYQESMPAIVKILEYSGWELYLPDYKYDEILDKFVPIPGSKNIIEEEDYGFGLILKSVEKSPTSYGSGFVISKDGYILTNAHVISNLDVWEENLRVGLTLADYLILEEEYYLGNIDRDTYDYYIYLNDYLYEYLEITPNVDYRVVVGVDGFDTNSKIYTPEIIKTEGGTYEGVMDWTLLKINAENLEYLKIADSDKVLEGSEIFVIGYPSISEDDYSEEIEFKNNVKPTINKGIVSHIKTEGLYKTFQIDASASSGNSGGPVLNQKGEVIGILTSGINNYDGGIYNYAQRINDILPQISSYVNI
jgi:S1-C subfamily serine protease